MLRALAPTCILLATLSAQTTIPDTPAGRVLRAWLDAFNSGDRAQIQSFHSKYQPERSADDTLAFRQQTGGFDLLGVDKSEPARITFRLKEKASSTAAFGHIELRPGDPPTIAELGLQASPDAAKGPEPDVKLDAATRSRVIENAVAKL